MGKQSRRDFLTSAGAAGAGMLLAGNHVPAIAAEKNQEQDESTPFDSLMIDGLLGNNVKKLMNF